MASYYNLTDHIVFAGRVLHEHMPKMMNDFVDFVTNPNIKQEETFCIANVEAMIQSKVSERSERAFWMASILAMGVTGDSVIHHFFVRFHLACGVFWTVPEQSLCVERCS